MVSLKSCEFRRIAGRISLFLLTLFHAQHISAGEVLYHLSDAPEYGAFNLTGASATASRHDVPNNATLIRLDFSIPPKSAAGLWTKSFPAPTCMDCDELFFEAAFQSPVPSSVKFALEIKGSSGTQRVPLPSSERISERILIDWKLVGNLNEVVFSAASGSNAVSGALDLNAVFIRFSLPEKISVNLAGKLFLCIFASFVLAVILFSIDKLLNLRTSLDRSSSIFFKSPFAIDLAGGFAIACAVVCVLSTYAASFASPFDSIYFCILSLLSAAVFGILLNCLFLRRMPRPIDAFLDSFIPAALCTCASTIPVWHAPERISDFFHLSGFGASSFVLVFLFLNSYSLFDSKKRISVFSSFSTMLAPFIFGILLSLQNSSILCPRQFGELFGSSGVFPLSQIVFCAVLIFLFNSIVFDMLGKLCGKNISLSPGARLKLFSIALFAAAAPRIADLGSGSIPIPHLLVPFAATIACAIAEAALWGEVFMMTGMALDAARGIGPQSKTIWKHAVEGMKKGLAFSAILMAIIQIAGFFVQSESVAKFANSLPLLLMPFAFAVSFPLVKTIVESFDGSQSFASRLLNAFRSPSLIARGSIAGFAIGLAVSLGLSSSPTWVRMCFGGIAGALAFAGVSMARDFSLQLRWHGGKNVPSAYLIESLLGAFVGSALGFYLDTSQLSVISSKLLQYRSFGIAPSPDDFYPLLSKWGQVSLSPFQGGAKLLFNESLEGVIGWGVAAWIFAVNKSFLTSIFERNLSPLKRLASKQGFAELTDGTIHVLRWGLWMAPIIFTFLKQMPDPTWYNQDGAIRSLFASFNQLTMSPEDFTRWSLKIFMWVLAYDLFRILIWLDHMGLRVSTIVNLSFIGMDRLDRACAKIIGKTASASVIPEGIKRFTTWAPLLVPFYIPTGHNWDWAWTQSEMIQNSSTFNPAQIFLSSSPSEKILCILVLGITASAAVSISRRLKKIQISLKGRKYKISNSASDLILSDSGASVFMEKNSSFDLFRRSYDRIDPSGNLIYLAEKDESDAWTSRPIFGNFPTAGISAKKIDCGTNLLKISSQEEGLSLELIFAPQAEKPFYRLDLKIQNMLDKERELRICHYLEWALNSAQADRNHTQFNRLFPELAYDADIHAVTAVHRMTRKLGFIASSLPPDGYLKSRFDFIGRAGCARNPLAMKEMRFFTPEDSPPEPVFEPAAALLLAVKLAANETKSLSFLVGFANSKEEISDNIKSCFQKRDAEKTPKTPNPALEPDARRLIHGMPPDGIGSYCEFRDDGRIMRVLTPFTPLPYDHCMANEGGHSLTVTNRGLHSSSNVNSQQNRLTPDWADTVTSEIPSEAIYVYDLDKRKFMSPSFFPLRDTPLERFAEFSLDGWARFFSRYEDLTLDLKLFVPPEDPLGVYLLAIKNTGKTGRKLRVAPFFRIALADFPENAAFIEYQKTQIPGTLLFRNPNNIFRSGTAFCLISEDGATAEKSRGKFLGTDLDTARPYMLENGVSDKNCRSDGAPISAFLCEFEMEAGAEKTIVIALGQADSRKEALRLVEKYRSLPNVMAEFENCTAYWRNFSNAPKITSSLPDFDAHLDWLKYQALVERIWARKGFYQSSGAYGFRDQLQDSINLVWTKPSLARRQILLHASQQFQEGDLAHWFFLTQDGRTSLLSRSQASDNLMWLPWAVLEYLEMSGDESILNEKITYLHAETPLQALPRERHGACFIPLRTTFSESLYEHIFRAIDLVLDKRLGRNGLTLIGTGDWNDGLDEIGCLGKGESVWLSIFLINILKKILPLIRRKKGDANAEIYSAKLDRLVSAVEKTWRGDRYLRAIHDDGTEIGVKDGGIWEIDALNASWAVISGLNRERAKIAFDTAVSILEKDKVILLGSPPLNEKSRPYLGRSCKYPEGIRENGMYCHGVQWLVQAARILAEESESSGSLSDADKYRETTFRLWWKISALGHQDDIEIYGGQANKQAADMMSCLHQGRMIWNGYTGAAAWIYRQAFQSVAGAKLRSGRLVLPDDLFKPRGNLAIKGISIE